MFDEFDPLAAKQAQNTEVAINAMKREIRNILDSYVGWFDPFCELTQNSLDALEERQNEEKENYKPELRIIINLKQNSITVSDNGTGLTKEKYEQFLAPCFSFKSGNRRGHKGVGATYLAYGFNFIQIATKTTDFSVTGKMVDARKWLDDENPPANPKVIPDKSKIEDPEFEKFDSGVSITLSFDKATRPADLPWIGADTAEQWSKILRLKTAIGSIIPNKKIKITIYVINASGKKSEEEVEASYLWPHELGDVIPKCASLRTLQDVQKKYFTKKGDDFRMPAKYRNLDAIYDSLDSKALQNQISLDKTEQTICQDYNPITYFCYAYTAKIWPRFNDKLGTRSGLNILTPGVQIAANNMPQGEILQIPLTRNIGRQKQIHVVVHFDNCRADLGRKGFQKEIVDFCQSVARKLIENPIQKIRSTLRPVTGSSGDLLREQGVDNWKKAMETHEKECPLEINNDHFFHPTRRVSLTSAPTREQDVIALFNQLLAGGIIRGIMIMSTNERLTYDGMYRVIFDAPLENHIYDKGSNPLGVLEDNAKRHEAFTSTPKILEYKYSLDALIENLEEGGKNSNDIDLVVVWETGSDYKGNYLITSFLDPDNLSERQYHGITHIMTNVTTGQKEMDLVVLEELIDFLNNPSEVIAQQIEKYDSE